VGITELYAQKNPEAKLAIVRKDAAAAKTLYVGDGISRKAVTERLGLSWGEESQAVVRVRQRSAVVTRMANWGFAAKIKGCVSHSAENSAR
jgi:hypothetical protein